MLMLLHSTITVEQVVDVRHLQLIPGASCNSEAPLNIVLLGLNLTKERKQHYVFFPRLRDVL